MGINRSQSRIQSSKMAFCGLMAALSVSLMLTGGLIPVATYCSPMISAVFLLPILVEYGKKSAWIAYVAVSCISLLLGIDKEAAFFYLFLGYYPILKWSIDRCRNKAFRILLKLFVFNISITLMYTTLGFLLNMHAIVEEFTQMSSFLLLVFILVLNACLFLYDRLLFPLVFLYIQRIHPKLRFLRR